MRAGVATVVLGAVIVGCHSEHVAANLLDPPLVTTQRLRTSWHGDGAYLGIGVHVTDANGAPIDCDGGDLTLTLEWSEVGKTGPFTTLGEDDVIHVCEPAGGDVALVVDNSQSLNDELEGVKSAAQSMLSGVLTAGGQASLVRVSTNASKLSELTSDQTTVATAIEGLEESHGWTALWDGVRMGNETLGGLTDEPAADLETFCASTPRAGVVAFTDGQENNSSDTQEYNHVSLPGDGLATRLEDLFDLTSNAATTPVYTVGMGGDVDGVALASLADETGARYLHIDGADELPDVFGVLGDYFTSNEQVCAEVPDGACGTNWVRVSWQYTDNAGSTVTGQTVQSVTVDCPSDPTGNSVVVLLTLSNPGVGDATASTLAVNAVDYASAVAAPKVLVVLDENHHDEYAGDADYVAGLLGDAGFDVTRLDEPDAGSVASAFHGYDVVWYSNPGYPMDDLGTFEALEAYQASGGGLIMQGDDMGWSWGAGFSTSPLTHLDFLTNGTDFCGRWTDNDAGSQYRVTFGADPNPVTAGLEGQSFLYGDDIDSTVARGEGETVVATATLDGDPFCDTIPVVVAWEL